MCMNYMQNIKPSKNAIFLLHPNIIDKNLKTFFINYTTENIKKVTIIN